MVRVEGVKERGRFKAGESSGDGKYKGEGKIQVRER